MAGTHVYLGCGDTLRIFNVDPRDQPREVGQYKISSLVPTSSNSRGTKWVGTARGLRADGNQLFIACGANAAHVADISDPAKPRGIWFETDARGYASDVAVDRQHNAILIASSAGLVISDLSR